MTRQQWLWLFVWIFVFFIIFCTWNKTQLLSNRNTTSVNNINSSYEKYMNVNIIKQNNNITMDGVVANELIYNELVDAYSKNFDIINYKKLVIQKSTKPDKNISEILANLAEDLSHFNSGSITYNKNQIIITGITDNTVTKGSISEKLKYIRSKGINTIDNLILNEMQLKEVKALKEVERESDKNITYISTKISTKDSNIEQNSTDLSKSPMVKSVQDIQNMVDKVMKNNRVQFLFARDILSPGSKEIIDKIIHILHENNQTKIEVIGHTDSDGKKKDNLILSQKRATTVKEYMIEQDIEEHRITSIGYGESKPLVKNTTSQNKQINRRVEFKVIGDKK